MKKQVVIPFCFALNVLLVPAAPSLNCIAQINGQNGDEKESVAIYYVSLEKIFPNKKFNKQAIKLFIFENKTRFDSYDGPNIITPDLMAYIPAISQELFDDFKRKNAQQYLLPELDNSAFKYQLFHSSDFRGDSPIGGWRDFYDKYPDSPGLISFSKVGFTKDKNRALVYIAHAYGTDGGRGILLLLKWDNKIWKVMKKEIIWVWIG